VGGATVAPPNHGIIANGTYPGSGGHFEERVYSGRADIAKGYDGIIASSSYIAGQFIATGGRYRAEVGNNSWNAAGFFDAPFTGVFTIIADASGWGLASNGPKAFIQNHPTDPTRLMAYIALEGPEAGTYTRGSGSIRGRVARVALDPTFALTTDPEVGLTAVVTPRSPRADLYVMVDDHVGVDRRIRSDRDALTNRRSGEYPGPVTHARSCADGDVGGNRQLVSEDRIRCVRDKQFKYIRNFEPQLPYAQRVAYGEEMPTMRVWRKWNAEGKLNAAQRLFFAPAKPREELYDCSADPHEARRRSQRHHLHPRPDDEDLALPHPVGPQAAEGHAQTAPRVMDLNGTTVP
jgi:hypothetical protein